MFFLFYFLMSRTVCVRGNWEISRRDLNSTHLVSMVSTDQNLINSNYDQYSPSSTGSLICCRSVALIVISLSLLVHLCHYASTPTVHDVSQSSLLLVQFMVLLILRHTLPLLLSENKEYSFPLFMVCMHTSIYNFSKHIDHTLTYPRSFNLMEF